MFEFFNVFAGPLKRIYRKYEEDPSLPVPKRTAIRHATTGPRIQLFKQTSKPRPTPPLLQPGEELSSSSEDVDDDQDETETAFVGNSSIGSDYDCFNKHDSCITSSDESYSDNSDSCDEMSSVTSDSEYSDIVTDSDDDTCQDSSIRLDDEYSVGEIEALCIMSYIL